MSTTTWWYWSLGRFASFRARSSSWLVAQYSMSSGLSVTFSAGRILVSSKRILPWVWVLKYLSTAVMVVPTKALVVAGGALQ